MPDGSWPLMPYEGFPRLPPERGTAHRKAMKEWMGDPLEQFGPIWCPVAHMVAERPYGPGGGETKRGSRHFAPGAKLYVHRNVGYKQGEWQVEVDGTGVSDPHRLETYSLLGLTVSAAFVVQA